VRRRLVILSAIVTLAGAVLGAVQVSGQLRRPVLIGLCAAFFAAGAAMANAVREGRDARRRLSPGLLGSAGGSGVRDPGARTAAEPVSSESAAAPIAAAASPPGRGGA